MHMCKQELDPSTYAGAAYHVVRHGDRREAIFRNDGNRVLMQETLAETCERTGVRDGWIQREVGMEHRSYVSRAVSAYRIPEDETRKTIKGAMHICTDPVSYQGN